MSIAKVAGVGLWLPRDISVDLWLDADDSDSITHSGGAVSQWSDKSGRGNHVTQTTENRKPTTGSRTQNGRNVIDFDPSVADQLLQNTSPDMSGYVGDIFFLYKRDRTSEADYLFTFDGVGSGVQLRGNRFSDISFDGGFDGGPGFNTGGSSSDTNPHIWNARIDGTTGVYLFIDGTQVDQDTSEAGVVTIDDYIRLAADAFSGDGLDGFIGEVVVVTYQSTANRQKIEGYLAWKWGLVGNLPGGHPYEDSPPLV